MVEKYPFDYIAGVALQSYLVKEALPYTFKGVYKRKDNKSIYGTIGESGDKYLFQQHSFKWRTEGNNRVCGEHYTHSLLESIEDMVYVTPEEYIEIWKFYFIKA